MIVRSRQPASGTAGWATASAGFGPPARSGLDAKMYTTSSSAIGSWGKEYYGKDFQSLPPRHKVEDPQGVLLQVLASPRCTPTQGDGLMAAKAREQAQRPPLPSTMAAPQSSALQWQMAPPPQGLNVKCDRCDGPHPTHMCPYFSKERDNHEDALVRAQPTANSGSTAPSVVQARSVPQPGDGSCLFHSLAHFFGSSAAGLRKEAADIIERQPSLEISGTPLHKWVEWESGLSPAHYAARLRSPRTWGGALELVSAQAVAMQGRGRS